MGDVVKRETVEYRIQVYCPGMCIGLKPLVDLVEQLVHPLAYGLLNYWLVDGRSMIEIRYKHPLLLVFPVWANRKQSPRSVCNEIVKKIAFGVFPLRAIDVSHQKGA